MIEPKMLISGEFVAGEAYVDVVNPATGQIVGRAPDCSRGEFETAVTAARAAFPAWRAQSYAHRQAALRAVAGIISDNIQELEGLLVAEQGKPRTEARGELEAAAWWITQVADQELPVATTDAMPGVTGITRRVPLGVVGAIVPWNFPALLAVWKIGPALLTGNTLVLKPSPLTPLSTLRLGELLKDVFPKGVLNIVSGGDRLGPWLSAHPDIDKISFTGSTETGRRVMASAAETLKRLTLELGGNDAAIVLDDVDVDKIAEPLFWAAFVNAGQVCVAAKRIYVHETVYDRLVAALASIAANVQIGDGSHQGTTLGPVQNKAQYDRVKSIIDDCTNNGYKVITTSKAVEGEGYFLPITIVDNPPEQSRVVQEEAFGPIVPLLRFSDVDEVVGRVNASPYGLAGSVWSSDLDRAGDVAARLETGTIWINSAQGITPFAAFAGRKQSGLGVENGTEGLLEFTAPQTIYTPHG